LESGRLFEPQDGADGRKDVDVADVGGDFGGADVRERHQKRNPESRVIGEIAVGRLAVFAQGFAVIGGQDRAGFGLKALGPEP
jgi:hypothetical protein